MKKYVSLWICLLGMGWFLLGCNTHDRASTIPPPNCDPIAPKNDKADPPFISAVTWEEWENRGITIGFTTEQDILNLVGEPDFKYPLYAEGSVWACIYKYDYAFVNENLGGIEFQFIEGVITGIELQEPAQYLGLQMSRAPLQYYLDKYGTPDIVGWSWWSGARTLIWSELGLMAIVDVNIDNLEKSPVWRIGYFIPADKEHLHESMLSQYITFEYPYLPPGAEEFGAKVIEPMDPFGFTHEAAPD